MIKHEAGYVAYASRADARVPLGPLSRPEHDKRHRFIASDPDNHLFGLAPVKEDLGTEASRLRNGQCFVKGGLARTFFSSPKGLLPPRPV
jgi:hypothetical protein